MLIEVWSGGQDGVDQRAWDVAQFHGFATGGWMPRGFWTEEGNRPEFASIYGARECTEGPSFIVNLAIRNEWNVRDCDWTIIFHRGNAAEPLSKGTRRSIEAAKTFRKPEPLVIFEATSIRPARVAAWIIDKGCRRINCAGNRASDAPNLSGFAGDYLHEVFAAVKECE